MTHLRDPIVAACSGKPELRDRPLMSHTQACQLESLFKTLANATRLRMLHALEREPEICVTELSRRLEMKPQAISNQLQRLTDRGILQAERVGNRVYYQIVNPCVLSLLDRGWCLAEGTEVCPD